MHVRVDRTSAVPVSRQIADQIRAQCLSGALAPGTRMPSVRRLAQDLAVNQNTVLRVYEQLATDGLLDTRHGEGTFAAETPAARELRAERLRFADEMNLLIVRGRLLGLDRSALQNLFDEAFAQAKR